MKPTVFLMLGFPGSGKSTFARQLAEARTIIRISSDDIRPYMYTTTLAIRDIRNNPAVFGALDYVVGKLLTARMSVIYDANFNRRKDRKAHRLCAQRADARTILIWMKTPLEVAREREAGRATAGESLAIPSERYQQLVDRLQEPESEETVMTIDGLAPFEEQLRSFDEQLRRLRK